MKRREFLSTTAGGVAVAGAGCLTDGTALGSLGNTPRPAPPDCDGHDRFSAVDGVQYDEFGAFSLTTDAAEYAIGDELIVRLTNVSDARALTGRKPLFDVQKRYGDSWESIYRDGGFVHTYIGVPHPPGDGFTWELTLTTFDLKRKGVFLCGPLTAGTYRFVFFGMAVEDDDRNGLASRFEIVGSNEQ